MGGVNAVLRTVYEAPSRIDHERRVWYRCLSAMHFATPQVGWAVGVQQLLRTADGGKTWINQLKESDPWSFTSSTNVFAVSSKTCWVTPTLSGGSVRCGLTRDGGKTWSVKRFGPGIQPNNLFFRDSRRGWLVSDDGRSPAGRGRVHITNDGGEHWKTIRSRITGKPHKILFHNARKGWLIEHYGNKDFTETYSRLHTSDDGGHNWRIMSDFERCVFDLHTPDENHVILVGATGFLAQSQDGGKRWIRMKSVSRCNFNAIQFYQNRTGLAAGDLNTLLISKNGGQSWEKCKTSSTGGNFIGAHFTSNKNGVLASDRGLHLFEILD